MSARVTFRVLNELRDNLGSTHYLALQKVEKRVGNQTVAYPCYRFVNYHQGKLISPRGQGLFGEIENFKSLLNQMAELEKAGLNPALLYGMGGGGGQSTSVNTGSVSGGSAPTGGREVQDMISMGL